MDNNFIDSAAKLFRYYKLLADKSIAQLKDEQLFWQPNSNSNNIAVIVRHLSGNMLSRFTNFLTEDGEKEWRDRDAEFNPAFQEREELLEQWERGWNCLFHALDNIKSSDLDRIVYIRNEGHTVIEAINRQLAHYPYHVGQIVFIAKALADQWQSLSIPPNASEKFNAEKFSREKSRRNFTDDYL